MKIVRIIELAIREMDPFIKLENLDPYFIAADVQDTI